MTTAQQNEEKALWVQKLIEDFVGESPENSLNNRSNERAWAAPIVGFSRGDDPLYTEYKEHVGPFHWTPWEVFTQTFPGTDARPEDITVISWVLPQTDSTKIDNRKATTYPAERWARSRIYGEAFNVKLRQHVVAELEAAGSKAVAPMLSTRWERKTSDRFGFASTWSERHAAYACGLGTFGLCDGLITPRGKAMRAGSVVARIQIPATERPYTDHRAYCLFFTKNICGNCIKRCPVGALSESGHDKVKCREHLRPATADYVKSHYGFDGYGCGLCQTGVPCESKIPKEKDAL
jgi:hypothetical protein